MSPSHSERIQEFIKQAENLLQLYLSVAGDHKPSEHWYAILSAGFDCLISLSFTAVNTGNLGQESRNIMQVDLYTFLNKLLGDHDPGSPSWSDIILRLQR